MKDIGACLSHKSDEWSTPSNMYRRFIERGYFDPCPINHVLDGLSINWKKWNFVNPPYSDISKWIDKAIQEASKGNYSIMLLPSRTDTQWFKKLCLYGCDVLFIEGRLKFNDLKSAPFPSMFVIVKNTRNFYFMRFLTRDEIEGIYYCNERV